METLETLDAQIAFHEEKLLQLKRRRNALNPLCHLPFELLIYILKLIQRPKDAFKADIMTYSWEPFDNSWVNVAAICAPIREKVMQAVDIWAAVDVHATESKWIDYCMERAGDMPLTIRAVRGNNKYNKTKDSVHVFASKNLSRARAIYLRPDGTGLRSINAALNRHAPALQSLDYKGKFTLTPQFLGGSCEQLQRLVLNGATIGKTEILPRLRHLVLKLDVTTDTWPCLLELLAKAPNLELVSLSALSEYTKAYPPNFKIPVCHLRKLEVANFKLRSTQALLTVFPTPTEELLVQLGSIDQLDIYALWQSATPAGVDLMTKLTPRYAGLYPHVILEATSGPNSTSPLKVSITDICYYDDMNEQTHTWDNIHTLVIDGSCGGDIWLFSSALAFPDLKHIIIHNMERRQETRERIVAWLRCNNVVASQLPYVTFRSRSHGAIDEFGMELVNEGLVSSYKIVR
jgi:hypothetical protein